MVMSVNPDKIRWLRHDNRYDIFAYTVQIFRFFYVFFDLNPGGKIQTSPTFPKSH